MIGTDACPDALSRRGPRRGRAGLDKPSGAGSASALSKVTKKTADPLPVHSFASLLEDLATIAANRITPSERGVPGFTLVATPTPVQSRAFHLLGLSHRLGYA